MENIRIVDNDLLFSRIKDQIKKGESVPLQVSGSSMSPFLIHIRDTVYISSVDRKLKKGDIVFFQRTNGQYVMHRICKIDKEGNLYLIGDGQVVVEGPIKQEQVFAIIHQVIRKGEIITEKQLMWKAFSRIWVHLKKSRFLVNKIYKFTRG